MFISRKSARAFTLLEVCVALTLLVLIAGSIYSVLRGSIDTAASVRESQNRSQEIEGFMDLCARTFHALPGPAKMESRIRQQGSLVVPDLIIRQAPQLLSWGTVEDLGTVSVLGLIPQVGGRYSIALLRNNPGDDPLADPVARAKPGDWLPLVSDVTKLTWRFYDKASNRWLDVLSPGQNRPLAVELTLELADEPQPIRAVFEIIPLASTLRTGSNQAQFTQGNPSGNSGGQPNSPNQQNSGNQPNSRDGTPGQGNSPQRGSGNLQGNTPGNQGQPNFIGWEGNNPNPPKR